MTETEDRPSLVWPAQDTAWSHDEGTVVLLRVRDGAYTELQGTAAAAWLLLDALHDVDEVATLLAEHFEAPRQRVREDVHGLVAELLSDGLLSTRPSAALSPYEPGVGAP